MIINWQRYANALILRYVSTAVWGKIPGNSMSGENAPPKTMRPIDGVVATIFF